ASFASHVHRVQQVLDAAAAHHRKVAFVGRSMVRNMTIAAEMGYLEVPPDTLVDVRKIDDLPDDRMVLMCTGSQGEPMAALSRIANRDHRVNVGEGDVVIMASSLIPATNPPASGRAPGGEAGRWPAPGRTATADTRATGAGGAWGSLASPLPPATSTPSSAWSTG